MDRLYASIYHTSPLFDTPSQMKNAPGIQGVRGVNTVFVVFYGLGAQATDAVWGMTLSNLRLCAITSHRRVLPAGCGS